MLTCSWTYLGLKTDGNIPIPIRSIFYFCPSVSVFVGSRFRIYESRNDVFPSVVALGGGPQPGGVVHPSNPRGWLLGEA